MAWRGRYMMILLLGLMCSTLNAQQLPIFSQYVMNGFVLNPAIAGYDGYTSVNTTARQQWLGFKGAPQTFFASWQTRMLQRSYRIVRQPVRNRNMLLPSTKGRVGLGAYVINDKNGNVSRTGIQFTYAYHLILNGYQISFGLAGKLFQYRIAEEDLVFGSGNTDLILGSGIKGVGYTPDVDFGMYISNSNYFIGASVNNLMQSVIRIGGGTSEYKILRHYWVMGGYRFKMGKNLALEPNTLLKTTEKWIPQCDLGMKLYYQDNYWLGVAFRTDGSLITLLGFNVEGLHLGYAFDYSFSSIQRFNYGTHEVSIAYKFGDDARRYRWLRRY